MSTGFSRMDPNGLPVELADFIILNVGEQVKKIWDCTNYDEVEARRQLDMFKDDKHSLTSTMFQIAAAKSAGHGKGYLILTDRRAVFVHHKEYTTGMFEKKVHHDFHFKMSCGYDSIVASRVSNGYLSIDINNQGQHKTQNFHDITEINPNLLPDRKLLNNEAKEIVLALIQERLQAIEEEKKRSRVSLNLDFSFLKDAMIKGGVIVQNIKCPSCGASVVLPSSGNSLRCEYCKSTIYAQDVFEKMKGLIGDLSNM